MSKKVGAILLDTRSIQRYVFGSNKLKTNTGASYLVDAIFSEAMIDVLCSKFKLVQKDWEDTGCLKMVADDSIEAEIAYIGGGNMLVLVNKGEAAASVCRELVQDWSLKVLLNAPGLKTGVAIGELEIDNENNGEFKISLDDLYKQLKENQNNILPQVDLPYTGFTIECDYSGKAANVFSEAYGRLVSAEVLAKINAYTYAAAKNKIDYSSSLGEEYEFCSELESIGFAEGESYISVIHIDGNNMGVKFSNCRNMNERKELSLKVKQMVKDAFEHLVNTIINEYKSYDSVLDMRKLQQGKKLLLPLRPIIIGGDDITFICPGRMGLEYAKRFIECINRKDLLDEKFEELFKEIQSKEGKMFGRRLSCCAGVAIVPAKYPFFRAYELAEQLCSEAKAKSRKDDGSYLDFAILHGEKYGDIGLLRKEQYLTNVGRLHYGPYRVLGDKKDKDSMEALFALTKDLMADSMPHNKVKELRRVLHESKHSMSIFLENCPEIRQLLQKETGVEAVNADSLWEKDNVKRWDKEYVTRYIDAIEIMDFVYPQEETEVK